MPLPNRPLHDAFARGAVVVTPNRRLARRLVALHDDAQRASGLTVWPAATALPWDTWLVTLWQDALAAGVEPGPTRLQTRIASTHAWNRIVAVHASPLIDRRGAAGLAADAWTLVHAWGAGGQSWRGWASSDDGDDDPGTFARWADAYAGALERSDAVDAAQLPDWLAGRASRVGAWRDAPIVLAGFLELAPQQERLLAALAAAGARIERVSTLPDVPGQARRVRGATPRDEIARALGWARARALAEPGATIGIAIEDLALRREEVRVLAEDILCPALQWPGRESAARPYNMSLGVALAEVPLVAAALDLIAIAGAVLPAGRAAALLRSPYLPVAPETLAARAGLEAEWLRQGRAEISFSDAVVALGIADGALAQRWRSARDTRRLPAKASPRGWAEAWRSWLHAFGWPGDRALTSGEYQARGAWDEALAQFATLDAMEARLSSGDALSTLRAHLAATVFQPEAPRAPIQILGILEAAGLPFDALWVGGLGPERWPPAPQPNPLLPLAWQRSRNVPRATAARELAYARTLIDQFARAAPDVVFSHAGTDEDHRSAPSMLVPAGTDFGPGGLAVASLDGSGAARDGAKARIAAGHPRSGTARRRRCAWRRGPDRGTRRLPVQGGRIAPAGSGTVAGTDRRPVRDGTRHARPRGVGRVLARGR